MQSEDIINIENHILDAMDLSNSLVCTLRESKYRVNNGPLALEYASALFSNFLLNEYKLGETEVSYKVKYNSLKMSCKATVSQIVLSSYSDIENEFRGFTRDLFNEWEKIISGVLIGAKSRVDTYINIENQISNESNIIEDTKNLIADQELLVMFVGEAKNENEESEGVSNKDKNKDK